MEYLARIAYSRTYDNSADAISLAESLHEDFSLSASPFIVPVKRDMYSALDATMLGPFNIKITLGGSSFTIVSCFVNNFGSTIEISEEVILREYSFFGRNIITKV